MKKLETVIERGLRNEVKICARRYDFMREKVSTDTLFSFRMLMEKY